MAHRLEIRDGSASIFSVRETPWHQLGTILTEAPSWDEAIKLSRLDYTVSLRDVRAEAAASEWLKAEGYRAVVRDDTQRLLAVVSDDYTPLQNLEAVEVLKPLVDTGLAELETGGVLRDGADAWLLVKFLIDHPVVQEVFAGEIIPFGLVTNNHSGRRKASLLNTPIRVVCANTLGLALGGLKSGRSQGISIAHRGNARIKLVDAAQELWGQLTERYVAAAEQYKQLKERILTVEQFIESVLDVVSPRPEAEYGQGGSLLTGGPITNVRAIENANARRNEISRLWEEGDGHKGDHSAWEAYNGVVQAIDHDEVLFPTRVSRVESLLVNGLSEKKQAVLESLLSLK